MTRLFAEAQGNQMVDLIPAFDAKPERLASVDINWELLHRRLAEYPTDTKVVIEGPAYVAPLKCRLAVELLRREYDVVLSADILWGACCVGVGMANALNRDLTIHIGHDCYCSSLDRVLYVPVKFTDEVALRELTRRAVALALKDGVSRVEVLCALEFMDYRQPIIEAFESNGIEVLSTGHPAGTARDGQFLVCDSALSNLPSAKNAPIVAIADQLFGIGLHYDSGRVTLVIDPYRDRTIWLDAIDPFFIRERERIVEAATRASTFGIIVETRPGQSRLSLAQRMARQLKEIGVEVLVVGVTELTVEKLAQYGEVDYWINTACKRLVTDRRTLIEQKCLTTDEAAKLIRLLRTTERAESG